MRGNKHHIPHYTAFKHHMHGKAHTACWQHYPPFCQYTVTFMGHIEETALNWILCPTWGDAISCGCHCCMTSKQRRETKLLWMDIGNSTFSSAAGVLNGARCPALSRLSPTSAAHVHRAAIAWKGGRPVSYSFGSPKIARFLLTEWFKWNQMLSAIDSRPRQRLDSCWLWMS